MMRDRYLALVVAAAAFAGCGESDGGTNTGGGGATATHGASSSGPGSSGDTQGSTGSGMGCAPGAQRSCYTGPDATEGIGLCQAGTETCLPDGSGFGGCDGEVLP